MAKEGIVSFLLDCRTNENIAEIEAEFGIKGFAIVVRLWQKIYSEKGYYCEWTERSPLLFLSQWFGGNSGVDVNLINQVVNKAIKIGIFSKEKLDTHSILTSRRIQEQYFDVVKRRKSVEALQEYLLVSVDNFGGNIMVLSKNVCRNPKNVCRNETSKVKESKVKKSNTVSNDTVCQTDVRRVVEEWNTLSSVGIKSVTKLASGTKRYNSLIARLKQYGIDDVLGAINEVRNSDFLQGKHSGKPWEITFDWFVLPNNFPKVLDGNYRNKDSNNLIDDSLTQWIQRKEGLNDKH